MSNRDITNGRFLVRRQLKYDPEPAVKGLGPIMILAARKFERPFKPFKHGKDQFHTQTRFLDTLVAFSYRVS